VDDGAKAKALLEGKEADKKPATVAPAAAVAPTGRFIVQVGAFADVLKAREARQKLEKAGLKTYTQVVQSTEGRRIRVRVGPFEGKAEADKAAEKIKKLDLPAAILEL
jgi:DedD protein